MFGIVCSIGFRISALTTGQVFGPSDSTAAGAGIGGAAVMKFLTAAYRVNPPSQMVEFCSGGWPLPAINGRSGLQKQMSLNGG